MALSNRKLTKEDIERCGVSGGGGSDDIFIVRMVPVENEEDETFMLTTDKTFDEVWEARNYDESLGGRKLILLENNGRYSQLMNYSSEEDGTKCLFFASGFNFGVPNFDKIPNLTYSPSATHTLWRNDGKMYMKQFTLPNDYCGTDAYEEILNVPQPW